VPIPFYTNRMTHDIGAVLLDSAPSSSSADSQFVSSHLEVGLRLASWMVRGGLHREGERFILQKEMSRKEKWICVLR
jgi:hypothetical protein